MPNAKISLVGNIVRDPEMREINGQNLCSFSVAVNTTLKKQDGSYESNYYDCSMWGKRGEFMMQRAQRGTSVWITGDMTFAEYTGKDGTQKNRLRVTVDSANILARGKDYGTTRSRPDAPQANESADEMPF